MKFNIFNLKNSNYKEFNYNNIFSWNMANFQDANLPFHSSSNYNKYFSRSNKCFYATQYHNQNQFQSSFQLEEQFFNNNLLDDIKVMRNKRNEKNGRNEKNITTVYLERKKRIQLNLRNWIQNYTIAFVSNYLKHPETLSIHLKKRSYKLYSLKEQKSLNKFIPIAKSSTEQQFKSNSNELVYGLSVSGLSHMICKELHSIGKQVSKHFVSKIVYNQLKRLNALSSTEYQRISNFFSAHSNIVENSNSNNPIMSENIISEKKINHCIVLDLCNTYLESYPETNLSKEQIYATFEKLYRSSRKKSIPLETKNKIILKVDSFQMDQKNFSIVEMTNQIEILFPHISREQLYKIIYNRVMKQTKKLTNKQKELIEDTISKFASRDDLNNINVSSVCDELLEMEIFFEISRSSLYKHVLYRMIRRIQITPAEEQIMMQILEIYFKEDIPKICDYIQQNGITLPRELIYRFIKKKLKKFQNNQNNQ